uniref:Uncharacterized protein n=1 Tax=Physcomitrium patens TaxID=3218 RepID=A0A2K1JM39_PHYPA|nr:hypothetical protein PHYPA_017438 [Physcomitrium patens]
MLRTAETKKGKVLPKGLARSGSGLGALASLHDPHQDLCSPENTFGSPLEACLDCVDQQDELSFQVELTNCPSPAEPVIVPSVNSSIIVDQNCTSNEPLEEDLGDDMAVGLKDLQYDHPEPSNDSDRIMAKVEVEGEKQNAHAKDAHGTNSFQNLGGKRLGLPTESPPQYHSINPKLFCIEEKQLRFILCSNCWIHQCLYSSWAPIPAWRASRIAMEK